MLGKPTDELEARFWSKVNWPRLPDGRPDEASCWEWLASRAHRYGVFGVRGKNARAHRVAYELWHGAPIPVGADGLPLTIDHLCGNTLCCNPVHLEPVTARENIRRYYAAYVACSRGHSLDLAYVAPDGARHCRECHNRRRREYRLSRQASAVEGS